MKTESFSSLLVIVIGKTDEQKKKHFVKKTNIHGYITYQISTYFTTFAICSTLMGHLGETELHLTPPIICITPSFLPL